MISIIKNILNNLKICRKLEKTKSYCKREQTKEWPRQG